MKIQQQMKLAGETLNGFDCFKIRCFGDKDVEISKGSLVSKALNIINSIKEIDWVDVKETNIEEMNLPRRGMQTALVLEEEEIEIINNLRIKFIEVFKTKRIYKPFVIKLVIKAAILNLDKNVDNQLPWNNKFVKDVAVSGCKIEDLYKNESLTLQEWIHRIIKDNKLEYLEAIDDGKVDDDALTLLMKSWKTNLKLRQHVKEYEEREYAHKIYEKLGWEKDHYDVICSAWTTYVALLVNYAHDNNITYNDYNSKLNMNQVMYYYSGTKDLGYWYKSNGKEAKGTLRKSNNKYPESSYYNKFLDPKNVHSEFAKNIAKEVVGIQDLSALCHCVANFMPCPDECGVGEFSYNQIKGILPEVRDYFPLMIDKIQKCVSDDTGLIYNTSNGESEISKEIIKKWHAWFLENKRKYFLDEFYYVTKEGDQDILVGIPLFKGQSLENPMPNNLCEAKECLDNILYIIQNRALKMAYFLK